MNELRQRQPELEITDNDELCVQVAGLCHDLGKDVTSENGQDETRENFIFDLFFVKHAAK